MVVQKSAKYDRETGELVTARVLQGSEHASIVRELHQILYRDAWENQQAFQSVAMLAWAGFLAGGSNPSNSGETGRSTSIGASPPAFSECEDAELVIKKAVEGKAFTTIVDVLLKYMPDRQHDALVFGIFERNLELIMLTFASKLLIDVPTLADKAALAALRTELSRAAEGSEDGDEEPATAWNGDCLENLMTFAVALCAQNPRFCRSFWHNTSASGIHSSGIDSHDRFESEDELDLNQQQDQLSCHPFLIACRDAAFKNPACLTSYLRLVAAAARGSRECAQHAFHHVKQNPAQLSWDQFFLVMAKYQRLLLEAERPLLAFPGAGAGGFGIGPNGTAGPNTGNGVANGTNAPGPRFIRPKELEALESIQAIIQAVVLRDQQLALLFFHNHDWSPIATFVAFLQSRIPSSLKGALMKTLAAFARVPEIAPFVWREVDALQILRTTGDTSGYGNQDLAYELEHYESLSRAYPATRGLVALLHELFSHPVAWNTLEGDGRVAAIQVYFEFLLDRVFLKFDLRKYDREEEKWALANGALAIFKQILHRAAATSSSTNGSTPEGGLAYQLLARFLSSSPLLEKLLTIVSGDDGSGVDNLENSATDLHLEHSFFYCLDIVKRATEAKHGSLNFVIDISKRSSDTYLTKTSAIAALRERCVQHALEILVLVLEADAQFVKVAGHIGGGNGNGLQVERLHAILSRHRAAFVHISTYVKYSKAPRIPHLSAAILRILSNRIGGRALVDLLLDSGSSADVTSGYVSQLLNSAHDDIDEGVAEEDEESEQREEPIGRVDATELTIAAIRARAARSRKVRQEIGDLSGATRLEDADEDEESALPPSIRSAILDLLLENLSKPAPNIAHLLLGVLDDADTNAGSGNVSGSALDAVLSLVCSAEFGVASPDLARRCYKLLHLLLTQDYSSGRVYVALESERFAYFATQLELFSRVFRISRRRSAVDKVAELDMRGWFFKSLAVYLHIGLHKEPPAMKMINLLMGKLLSTSQGSSSLLRPHHRQEQMLLLRLLDETSFDLAPPNVPTNEHVVALAEKNAGTVEHDFFNWLRIDVERFIQALQTLDFTSAEMFSRISTKRLRSARTGNTSTPMTDVEQFIQWAIQWNVYSERVAAESHALNSLRELMEVIVLDYLALPAAQAGTSTPAMWQGLDAVGSAEVRLELASGIVSSVLSKVTSGSATHSGSAIRVSAQLFEIVAQIALLLVVAQRRSTGAPQVSDAFSRQGAVALVELLVRSIAGSANATGNPAAARNARTLLYTCIVHLLDRLPAETSSSSSSRWSDRRSSTTSISSLLITPQLIDLIARDASDGDDPLNMALAVAAIETILAVESADALESATRVSTLVAAFRERGYLLHFIGIFRKLIEMDAVSFDRVDVNGKPTLETLKVQSSAALPSGVDGATLGTIYECLLSFFTRVASTRDGALALVEGGLIRTLTDASNLPTHRPKHLHDSMAASTTSASIASATAFDRIVSVYYRKWLPVVRVVSACCAALPQHRSLAAQVLELVSRHRKLFTSSLKVVAASNDGMNQQSRRRSHPNGSGASYRSTPMDLSLLREVSYVTFILRYVTPFDDLCATTMTPAKWEKLAQLVVQSLLFFGQELVPKGETGGNKGDTLDLFNQNGTEDRSSVWWRRTVPRTPTEHREAAIGRSATCGDCHEALLDKFRHEDAAIVDAVSSTADALLHTTLFDEEKLYTSRMIVCNAAAYCSTRMLTLTRPTSGNASANNLPLLAATHKPRNGRGHSFPSMVGSVDPRAFAAATDPLWAHAPSMSEFTALFDVVVDALESGKGLLEALIVMSQTMPSSSQPRHRCELSHVQHVAEYHVDSLTFVAENMLAVLLVHFSHYLSPQAPADKEVSAALQPTLIKVLTIIREMEVRGLTDDSITSKVRILTVRSSSTGIKPVRPRARPQTPRADDHRVDYIHPHRSLKTRLQPSLVLSMHPFPPFRGCHLTWIVGQATNCKFGPRKKVEPPWAAAGCASWGTSGGTCGAATISSAWSAMSSSATRASGSWRSSGGARSRSGASRR